MKTYTVDIGGVEHTMRLDEDEAKRRGAKPVPEKKAAAPKAAAAPKNKARSAQSKS